MSLGENLQFLEDLYQARYSRLSQHNQLKSQQVTLVEKEHHQQSLAEKCGFDASNIGRGIKLGSSPSLETAVKIAKELNVSVEYLVTGSNRNFIGKENYKELQLLHKYSTTLKDLESLPDQAKKPIITLIENLKEEFS